MIAETLRWAGGGSGIVWSLVFMLNSSPIPWDKEKANKSNNDDILTLL